MARSKRPYESCSNWADVTAALHHIENLAPGIKARVSMRPILIDMMMLRIYVYREVEGVNIGLWQREEAMGGHEFNRLPQIAMRHLHEAYWRISDDLTDGKTPRHMPK